MDDKQQFLHYINYLHGRMASEDRQQLEAWYADLEDVEPMEVPTLSAADKRRLLDRLLVQIDGAQRSHRKHKVLRLIQVGAAAIVLLALGYGWLQYHFRETEPGHQPDKLLFFSSAIGERKNLHLADGSVLTLFPNSRVAIMAKGNQRDLRKVFLLHGEVLFDIARDTTRRFIVQTDHLVTTVLGTQFRILSDPNLPTTHITVYSGKVQVATPDSSKILNAGQEITFDKERALFGSTRQTAALPDLRVHGQVILQQADFQELSVYLKNYLGIHIHTASARIRQQRYSLPIHRHSAPADLLQTIADLHKNRYRSVGDSIIFY
ncbi:FecR family protein [Sphingobacterium lactis]|uniref:Ferric-dicitrate binding protein FerR, regulates iron transport through sigma-19 n=1 Tax=Sphingobacterium lactis TaxID=797291 RepID=A0A1H5YV80_9SPHI|nr:FecR domain-containing protein [Sphingobacterium lactis]SEG27186.1 ferric-dicitrate binding protein FerR, regulates iron transport through sigma-19 [Sphingobacterium lactis]